MSAYVDYDYSEPMPALERVANTAPLASQEKSLAILQQALDELESSLHFVLQPEITTADHNGLKMAEDRSPASPLASQVEAHTQTINRIAFRVKNICHRIQY